MTHGRWRMVRVPGWLRVVVSVGLLAGLLLIVDFRAVARTLAEADIGWAAVLLCGVYGERFYSAFRWHQVLRWSRTYVPLWVVIRISFISSFAGLFLPGVVGVEALRVVGLARHRATLSQAFSSVLVDRLIAIVTLVPLVLIGLAVAPGELPGGIRGLAWAALGLVIVMVWLMLAQWPRRLVERLSPPRAWELLRPRLERLYAALDSYRSRPGMFAWALALGLGFQLMRVLVVWASARAVGIDVAGAYFFIFAPIIAFLALAPVSFAGIGIRDASYIYFFALVGVPAEQAFAASILVQGIGLLSCVPGGILYAQGSRGTELRETERELDRHRRCENARIRDGRNRIPGIASGEDADRARVRGDGAGSQPEEGQQLAAAGGTRRRGSDG